MEYSIKKAILNKLPHPVLIVLIIVSLFSLCSNAHADQVPLHLVMTKEEMQKTGVDSLPPEHKQALSVWLAEYTKQVIEQSSTYHPSKSIDRWIQSWPKYMLATGAKVPKQEQEELNKERQKNNMKIDKNRDEGAIIELRDGSVWQVGATYQYVSRGWNRGDTIEIGKSHNMLYPYWLYNVGLEEQVQAKQITPPSPTGQKSPEKASYFEGSTLVTATRGKGEFIDLQNGTAWKIAPGDQSKVRNWKKGDRVRVKQSDAFIYQYVIENLDSGETALANPV